MLWYQSAVVFFDRGHPPFWNLNSVIPIDVISMKSFLIAFFVDSAGVPMWVMVNNLNLESI